MLKLHLSSPVNNTKCKQHTIVTSLQPNCNIIKNSLFAAFVADIKTSILLHLSKYRLQILLLDLMRD